MSSTLGTLSGKRIALVTHGSRGDVQPNVALAVALQEAGAIVTFVALADHAEFVSRYGVSNFFPFKTTARGLFELLKESLGGDDPDSLAKFIAKYMEKFEVHFRQDMPTLMEAIVELPQDLLLYHTSMEAPVLSVAEKTGAKAATLIFVPWRATSAFPPPVLNPEKIPEGTTNLDLWEKCFNSVLSDVSTKCQNWFRREHLQLQEATYDIAHLKTQHAATVTLHAFSDLLVPTPEDWDSEMVKTVGYLVLKDSNVTAWAPSPELESFVAASTSKEAPLYFGFGSMIHKDPQHIFEVVMRTVAATGRKAVICEGWYLLRKPENFRAADYGIAEGQVLFVHDVPHTWLLPHCACSVIHGGAGTTAAAIRAGKPCVFLPFLIDQPWWAHRAIAAGVSPGPVLSSDDVTAEILTASVKRAIGDEAMAARAQELGERLCEEDGVANALVEIAKLLS